MQTYENINMKLSGADINLLHNPLHYVAEHWHKAIELLYMTSSIGSISIVNDTTIPLAPESIALVSSMCVHSSKSSVNNECLCIHIDPDIISEYDDRLNNLIFDLNFGTNDDIKNLKALLKQIYILYKNKKDGYMLYAHSLAYKIIILLIDKFSMSAPDRKNNNIERLKPLLSYVEHNYMKNISVKKASDILGLNEYYFCRLFKKEMGCTFIHYLNSVRLSYICKDLKKSDKNILQLAEIHGFTNRKLLYKMFRDIYGCTLGQKRKEL